MLTLVWSCSTLVQWLKQYTIEDINFGKKQQIFSQQTAQVNTDIQKPEKLNDGHSLHFRVVVMAMMTQSLTQNSLKILTAHCCSLCGIAKFGISRDDIVIETSLASLAHCIHV